jgi:hypothetical protein
MQSGLLQELRNGPTLWYVMLGRLYVKYNTRRRFNRRFSGGFGF